MPLPIKELNLPFSRCICASVILRRPCLLIAGNGDAPDYSQLHLSAIVRKGEWSAAVAPLMSEDEVPPEEYAREQDGAWNSMTSDERLGNLRRRIERLEAGPASA